MFGLRSAVRPLARQALVARRGYADVADGKLALSLVLPHQVGFKRGSRGKKKEFCTPFGALPTIVGYVLAARCGGWRHGGRLLA
jgi:hypothetical protein